KHSRGIHNAWQFWFELALVFTAQWFSLGGMRCSPLNAALGFKEEVVSVDTTMGIQKFGFH
ncbi:hypothetical protein P3553_17450, partial [Vibrio parahaemolyticus]|nr:hypothetical protein [Vibrio parahaemolyticus]